MKKLNQFVAELLETVNSIDAANGGFGEGQLAITRALKYRVGDSIYNHRVPSVRQVIRYLTRENSSTNQYTIGATLRRVYDLTRSDLRGLRPNNRTDALDIYEFINNVPTVVERTGTLRKVNSAI